MYLLCLVCMSPCMFLPILLVSHVARPFEFMVTYLFHLVTYLFTCCHVLNHGGVHCGTVSDPMNIATVLVLDQLSPVYTSVSSPFPPRVGGGWVCVWGGGGHPGKLDKWGRDWRNGAYGICLDRAYGSCDHPSSWSAICVLYVAIMYVKHALLLMH